MRGSFNYSGFVDIVADGRRRAMGGSKPSRPAQSSDATRPGLSLGVKEGSAPSPKAKPAA